MSTLLVIARDDPNDDLLEREAKRLGLTLLRLRLLDTEPGAERENFLAWLRNAPDDAAIAWTSKRAAEALVALALPALRESLARIPLFALGKESAAPMSEAGFTVNVPLGIEGAATLADWILGHKGDTVIARAAFLHGDKALPTLPDSLRAAGIEVDRFELYRTRFLKPNVSALTAALRDGTSVEIAYFSPSAVAALEQLIAPEGVAALRRDAVVHARGETTHKALLTRGYQRAPGPVGDSEHLSATWLGGVKSLERKSR